MSCSKSCSSCADSDRIPVRLTTVAPTAGPDGLVLADLGSRTAPPPGAVLVAFRVPDIRHSVGCACCAGRAPVAVALSRLFAERARGSIPFFRFVVAVSDRAGLAAMRVALETDAFLAARYREDERPIAQPG